MKSHQRAWRDKHVDVNLSNDWLEFLNNLKVFDLVSICEGHWDHEHPYESRPHLNLKMKPIYLPQALRNWAICKEIIQGALNNLDDCEGTYVHAHFTLDFSFSDTSFREEKFGIEFECSNRRTKDLPESWFNEWFELNIRRIKEIDNLVALELLS